MDEDGGEGHQEAVSHVEDADNLQEDVSSHPKDENDREILPLRRGPRQC